MAEPVIDILMYHSISDGPGPTNISADVFDAHMAALAESDTAVITLDDLLAAKDGMKDLKPESVIITFDDGFLDFAETAFPILEKYNFPAIVYLPTGRMGGVETWRGAPTPPRPLMSWEHVLELRKAGIQFGSHSVTHPDLDSLNARGLLEELRASKLFLEDKLGEEIVHFAPPYGIADHYARTTVERLYKTSVGTIFDRANLESDIIDLPRLEMFYYVNPDRWVAHVNGRGAAYLRNRQALRYAREAVSRPWERA